LRDKAVLEALHRAPVTFIAIVADWNRSQIVTRSQRHRDPKFPPRAFTQEGVAIRSAWIPGSIARLVFAGYLSAKWIKSLDMARI
jgi:hypothetical protein